MFGLMGQYHDAVGPAAYDFSFGGAIVDTDALPTGSDSTCSEPLPPPLGTGPPGWSACVDDAAIQTEILRVIRAHRLPTGLEDVYVMITPSGLGNCFDSGPTDCADGGDANSGYCGYHSATGNPGAIYAVIPYNAVQGHCQSTNPRPNDSTADPAISTLSHELAESVSDPLGDAWTDDSGNEIADLCITDYGRALGGSGSGPLRRGDRRRPLLDPGAVEQHLARVRAGGEARPGIVPRRGPRRWAARCVRGHLRGAGERPRGPDRDLHWTFGDGRGAGSGRSRVTHMFTRRGTYTVLLRTTDSWGNWTFSTRRVRVGAAPRVA